jgi:hypothetical protein
MASKNSRVVSRSTPPPIGGLNVRDAINNMPRGDAIELKNWIAQQYGLRCRKGYSEWVVNLSGACETVISHQPDRDIVSGFKLFAITNSGIYDATASTNAPVPILSLSGANGAGKFSSVGFANIAGVFTVGCSAEGGVFIYDGTFWTKRVLGEGVGQISGINPDNLVFVTSWKRKLWFVEKGTTRAWYLSTDSVAGVAKSFELGPFAKNGGKLSFITSWTLDAGEGIDDLIVFVFEGGDVLIYKGTDPNSAATFAMVGAYFVGAIPSGRRGFTKYGGDVIVLSELGLQPLSFVTRGGQSLLSTQAVGYLSKVQSKIAELVPGYPRADGWELMVYPKESYMILNLPLEVSNVYQQYVLSTDTNSWAVFEGMPIRCSAIASNGYWFGTADGKVCKGFDGFFDAVPYGQRVGAGIKGMIRPSFSYFGFPGANKQFLMVRPTFLAVDQPGVFVGMTVDYASPPPTAIPIGSQSGSAKWDTAKWGADQWGGSFTTASAASGWVTVEGLGYSGSAYVVTNVLGDTFLASIDYMFEVGGVL